MFESSKTSLIATLEKVQEHLAQNPNTPIDLLIDIQHSLHQVEWENDPKKYFNHWLTTGGESQMDTFGDAEKLFCAGFNYCQEEMEYQFNLPH